MMYIQSREGLGQVPMRYGPIAGTLGELPPLPPKVQDFLERVKRSPQDYEALILVTILHPEPGKSELLSQVRNDILDSTAPLEQQKPMIEKVVRELGGGIVRLVRGRDGTYYHRLIGKEKQFIRVVDDAFQKRIREMETKSVFLLESILTRALLAATTHSEHMFAGKQFSLYSLPPEIAERVLNSRVPEAHYFRLGQALISLAEQRHKSNPEFRKRVEQERNKSRK